MAVTTCPKCGSTKIENDECLHCGIIISKYLAYLQRLGAQKPGASAAGPVAPRPVPHMGTAGFKIFGDDMQFVELELAPGEAAVAEAGALMYMETGIEMQTTLSDNSQQSSGLVGTILGAGKRLLAHESLFLTVFTNHLQETRRAAFAAPLPGKILAMPLQELGGELIAQKDAFLVGAKGVNIDIAFQKKFTVGLFGGQGFIMERLRGDGTVFVNTGGATQDRTLQPNEMLRVDAGSIVALQPSVSFDIEYVGSVASALFGGLGLFLATLRGPGRVWIQSLTLSKLISRIVAQVPSQTAVSAPSPSAASAVGGGLGSVLASVLGSGGASDSSSGDASSDAGADSGGDAGSDSGSDEESGSNN